MTADGGPLPTAVTVGTSVLVVDDEFDLRFVVRLLLETAGYLVTEAINGRDALDRIRTDRPDVVVTDIDMPGMNGAELIDRIRADHDLDDLRIVAWSERRPDHVRADAVLSKGPGVRELAGHIERLLEGERRGPAQHR